jgi:hypothetical protein
LPVDAERAGQGTVLLFAPEEQNALVAESAIYGGEQDFSAPLDGEKR